MFYTKYIDEHLDREALPAGYRFMMASTHKGEFIDKYNHVSDKGNELILRYYEPGQEDQMHAIVFLARDVMV